MALCRNPADCSRHRTQSNFSNTNHLHMQNHFALCRTAGSLPDSGQEPFFLVALCLNPADYSRHCTQSNFSNTNHLHMQNHFALRRTAGSLPNSDQGPFFWWRCVATLWIAPDTARKAILQTQTICSRINILRRIFGLWQGAQGNFESNGH